MSKTRRDSHPTGWRYTAKCANANPPHLTSESRTSRPVSPAPTICPSSSIMHSCGMIRHPRDPGRTHARMHSQLKLKLKSDGRTHQAVSQSVSQAACAVGNAMRMGSNFRVVGVYLIMYSKFSSFLGRRLCDRQRARARAWQMAVGVWKMEDGR